MKNRSVKISYVLVLAGCLFLTSAHAQDVTITVDAFVNKKIVSPYIYGRNESFDKPATFYKDAGLRFARMNAGNNATKYNWRKKITSHPDWYNNVYSNDWDAKSEKVATDQPDTQVMWAFQLIGKVASSKDHNFDDWGFNNSQWWDGVNQNLAGGGTPNTANPKGKALVEGDTSKYLMNWPADSTVGILNHWFGASGIGLNKNQFLYWDMDNEPDIWNGTHDDVMSTLISASEFMDRFIEVAKKARALFPEIKICGPVTTSEWQWYKWGNEGITIDGKYYCWLEYFIKLLADEQKASSIRLLDVVDLHNYPYAPSDLDALQLHRIYYDKNYVYPGANGVKTINGGWDDSQTKEYIFQRINDWLTKYFGENHGISLGISEWGPSTNNPNVCSVVYGSALGTFANNGVELFSPWNWETGMWETLHLYSRYAKKYSVSSISSLENSVSAYTTVNESADSMTVIIVNRDMNTPRKVTININGFSVANGIYSTLELSALPAIETFKSHTDNALKESTVKVISNSFIITVPALSTTAVLLAEAPTGISELNNGNSEIKIFPNPAKDNINVSLSPNIIGQTEIAVYDMMGRKTLNSLVDYNGYSLLSFDITTLERGVYFF
ncbi:MAG: T9SS type A sorting domain-containing protein [Bacteroidia bacterium]|nr:T9SS type A sorting domain-containing protein [Bacteroidia bacterium]